MGKGIGRPVAAASMPVVRFGGEGKWRGEWGVKRGKCDAVSGRGGDTGAVHARASGGAGGYTVGCPRKKKLGGAHAAVRGEGGGGWAGQKPRPDGEGGRWLGLGEGGGPREEEGEWTGGRSHGPGGRRKRPGRNRCSSRNPRK
jgi:hypothetical protein